MKKIFTINFILFLGITLSIQAQKIPMEKMEGMKPRNIGPAGMSGRVTSIDVVLDKPQIIYVGTASGGLWKSESGGIDWKPIFEKEKVASVGAVAIDQSNPDVIWVGTGEGNPRNSQTSGGGIFKSMDGGKSWKLMGLEETRNIHRVIVHPENSDIVYVAAIGYAWGESEERGIFKTTDAGKTWKKILYVNEKTGCADLVLDPKNPNKLIAAMWEYRRYPWFFKSGGEGSGMYVTYNGGDDWEERTSEDGLPEGDLGRMGIAIAPSNPEVVYALVESKKNALYKSSDGGVKWTQISTHENIGNRPFYYADIYADPQNENRLYSLYTYVSVSEDGGRTFKVLLPWTYQATDIHPDHHAWWIHPEDPKFMIDGNDGGLNITRDGGKTWRFIENLPLAQFYHINIDMEQPYRVMGGMQDNGSWIGPAYVWQNGGIRNSYWQEIFFGDGFDVVPDPENPDYVYAMSQRGNIARIGLKDGTTKMIQPVHPEGEELRFNWNAGIAQDPFDANIIYFGSQYVHKSTDKGNSWTIISPDLTTNDPEKQKQGESGGLTYDVTGAENYTTILAISPSPVEQGVIWVSTDDGNLHITRDGGGNWEQVNSKLKGMPEGAWIPQVHVSTHEAGEAFVVANDYRRDDLTPYVYHTTDYGSSWKRIADEDKVWGYALSIVQDPVEPSLLFLGTEYGLYVSIDKGKEWTKWTAGYPTVSTMDMKIHPREHDLVIGTFGRAAFILDDIRPIREITQNGISLLEESIHVFEPPTAVIADYMQASGARFAGNAEFLGENREYGAMITFSLAKVNEENKKEKVKVEIKAGGEVIRTLQVKAKEGINRFYWNLRQKGVRSPGSPKPKDRTKEPSGLTVLPGTYEVVLSYNENSSSTSVEVVTDPRIDVNVADLQAKQDLMLQLQDMREISTKAVDRLDESKKAVDLVLEKYAEQDDEQAKQFKEKAKAVKDSLKSLRELILTPEDVQGIFRTADIVNAKIGIAYWRINSTWSAPNDDHYLMVDIARKSFNNAMQKINEFYQTDWLEFKEMVEAMQFSMFENYEPLEEK